MKVLAFHFCSSIKREFPFSLYRRESGRHKENHYLLLYIIQTPIRERTIRNKFKKNIFFVWLSQKTEDPWRGGSRFLYKNYPQIDLTAPDPIGVDMMLHIFSFHNFSPLLNFNLVLLILRLFSFNFFSFPYFPFCLHFISRNSTKDSLPKIIQKRSAFYWL